MKGCILLATIGVLTACTSVSDINARNDGHFSVRCYSRSNLVTWNHIRKTGLRKAKAYCSQSSKEMHEVAVHSEGLRGVTQESVEVVFDCI